MIINGRERPFEGLTLYKNPWGSAIKIGSEGEELWISSEQLLCIISQGNYITEKKTKRTYLISTGSNG